MLNLAAAAAFLFCGAPVQIHNVAMHSLLIGQMWMFNQMNAENVKQRYREKYGESADGRLQDDRRAVLRGEVVADVGEENWKQLGFSSFHFEDVIIKLLLGMQMTIVDCHFRSCFLTSDNPVVRTYPSSPDRLDVNGGRKVQRSTVEK